MDVWGWVQANWQNIYGVGVLVSAGVSALAAFVGIWWFAAYKYALGGLVLGWLPAGVAAFVAAIVIGLLWPAIAALALAVALATAR